MLLRELALLLLNYRPNKSTAGADASVEVPKLHKATNS